MALATLTIDLVAKLATLEQDLGKATRIAEKNAAQMEKAFSNVGKAVSGLFAGFAVNRAFQAFVTDVADLGDKLAKMSQKTGVAVEDLQKLGFAAELSDVSTDQLGASLTRLNRVMGEARDGSKSASEALARFGINGSDSALEAFNKIADRVKNTDDIARASNALSDVFGKQFADLIPLLKSGTAGLKEAGDELERMGGIMTTETALAAEKFNDDMTRLNKQFESLRNSVGSFAIPALNDLISKINDVVREMQFASEISGGFWASLFKIGPNISGKSNLELVSQYRKEIQELEADQKRLLSFGDKAGAQGVQQGIETLRLRKKFYEFRLSEEARNDSAGIYSNEGLRSSGGAAAPGISPVAPPAKKSSGIDKAQQEYDRLIRTIKEKIAVQDAELGLTGKITDAGKEYAKFLADVTNGYLKLTPQQLTKLAPMWDEFLRKAESLQAKQREIETAAARTQIGDLQDQFGRSNESRSDDMEIMPEAQRRLRDALRAVDEQARSTGDTIRSLYADGKIDAEQYAGLMREINDAIDGQKGRVSELEALQDRLNASWETGAERAFTAYLDSARNVAQQSEDAFSRAFQGMEDAVVKFAQTGKLDFRSLADSIIADLIRIQIKAAATEIMGSSGGLMDFIGGLFGGTTTTAASAGTSGLTMVADGGVFSSPSLSKYSGKVYDSPQFFQFAKGGGVFGEAGPEAIMPLSRGRNGKLGVVASGGSGGDVIINVIESPGNGGQTRQREEGGKKIIEIMVEQVKASIAGDISRGNGDVPGAMERTYGLNRTAGAY